MHRYAKLGVVLLSWPPPSWTMASGCRCNTFSGTRVMDVCGAWQLLLWCLISLTLHMLAKEDICGLVPVPHLQ